MVDIHSHILNGIDDGARDFQMSLDMLKLARAGGTSDIVATPHSDLQYAFQPDEMSRQISLLQAAISGIRIHFGCDFHLHFDNIRDCLANPTKYTVNHKRYLMVEFSDSQISKTTSEVFDRMLRLEITPIITHPERNTLLMKQVQQLSTWVEAGCLLQVTGQSFLGGFGKLACSAAEELMKRNLVHFVASDGHDLEHRPPTLKPAWDYIVGRYGEPVAERLFVTNPLAVLEGAFIDTSEQITPQKNRRWYQLW